MRYEHGLITWDCAYFGALFYEIYDEMLLLLPDLAQYCLILVYTIIHTTHEMWIWHWVCHCIPNWFSSICLLSPCYGHRYSIAPPIPCETQDRHRDVVIRIMTDLVLQYIVVTRSEWPIKVHSLTMDHLCWQKDVAILQVFCLVDRREPCTGTVHFTWQTYLTIC